MRMKCRPNCAACCIDISISSPLPGMPKGKPAGIPCVNLTSQKSCSIHGTPEYPAICASFAPSEEMCGHSYAEAAAWIGNLERLTAAPASSDLQF